MTTQSPNKNGIVGLAERMRAIAQKSGLDTSNHGVWALIMSSYKLNQAEEKVLLEYLNQNKES